MKKKATRNSLPCARAGVTTLLGLGAATTSQAVVQMGLNIPLQTSSVDYEWDIDNDGNTDLKVFGASHTSYTYVRFAFASFGYGGKLAAVSNQVAALTNNAVVDGAYSFRSQASVNSVKGPFTAFNTYGFANLPQNTPTTVGFSFQISGNTHYAIGTVNYAFVGKTMHFEIANVYYNDEPDAGISPSMVPEAETTAAGLAGLALGAAGLLRWRNRKQAA